MPKKNLYLVAGLVLLVLLAVGGYLVMNQNSKNEDSSTKATNTTNNNSTPPASSDSFNKKVSPAELFKTQKNITCKVSIKEGTGTIYIGDKKFFGEFDYQVKETNQKGFFIYNGQTAYVWSAGSKEGVKLELGPDALEKSNPQSPADMTQEADVTCSPWTVDSAKFNPPSTVNFRDFTSVLPN